MRGTIAAGSVAGVTSTSLSVSNALRASCRTHIHTEPAALTEDNMDSILARELRQLSLQDREAMNEEIHGVHTLAVRETPDFVTAMLEEMELILQTQFQQPPRPKQQQQQHLRNITESGRTDDTNRDVNQRSGGPIHNHDTNKYDYNQNETWGEAYREALILNSKYVHDTDFRTAFLRAELFDPIKAAARFVNFLQLLRDYLGSESLVNKPWTLKLFEPDELKILKNGAFQQFAGRDRAGRRIHAVIDDYGPNTNVLTIFKLSLYINMATSEDVETQQKGLVGIFYQMNPSTRVMFETEERAMIRRIINCIPLRYSGCHMCLPDSTVFSFVKAVGLAAAGPAIRKRFRFHFGSPMEIMYKLQTFGISPDQIPINSNTGKVKNQFHLKWLNMRQAMEEARASLESGLSSSVFNGIECPSHQDVLLGRGRPIVNHRGNVAMRQRVEARLARFSAATDKDEKTAIVWEVVLETYQCNGRFLKEDPGKYGWWEEVDQEVAKAKVGVYFRDLKCTNKATATATTASSSTPPTSGSIVSPALSSRSSPSIDSPPLVAARPPLSSSLVSSSTISSTSNTANSKNKIEARPQEFDSSTFEFLDFRGGKRSKHFHRDAGCFI